MTPSHAQLIGQERIGRYSLFSFDDGSTRCLPAVGGGDGSDPASTPPANPPANPPGNPPPPPPPSTFTQDDLNRVATAQKSEGERAAEKRILADLGVDKLDDAKAVLARAKEAETAAMTEAERAKAEALEAKRAADADRASAASDRRDAAVERALLGAGLALPEGDDKDDQRASVLSRSVRLVDIDGDPTPEKVKAAVAELKATMPALFAAPANAGNGNGSAGNGRPASGNPSGSSATPPPRDSESEGAKRAKARWAKHNAAVGA